ncbi:CYTH domain-containing protein [Devosia albogilva]|uniref:CYTH domain-containing protein n=1 Tax=Devosia albogilva TaxID=429726 RepID=A0ABW5QGH9_9HYPH
MAREIERKFLLTSEVWRPLVTQTISIRQGYLSANAKATVRVRLLGSDRAVLTLKGASQGISRAEFEYPIPFADALELYAMAEPHTISKQRHLVPFGGLTWEVDVFDGRHQGLVVAEVELEHADQQVPLPSWVGREVSDDDRYFNASLSRAAAPPQEAA